MLGAKARAAEYNAAKAAAARQQANKVKDAEENDSPPSPLPISLSSFTKNPSHNRNRGQKVYKPLVLSDEDGEDTGNIEQCAGSPDSPLNSPKPIPLPARPASLPPPQTFDGTMVEDGQIARTPGGYKNRQHVAITPRQCLQDNSLQYLHRGVTGPQHMTYAPHLSMPHEMPHSHHPGFYYPANSYYQEDFHRALCPPPPTPLSDIQRPMFHHSDTTLSNPEATRRLFEAIYSNPQFCSPHPQPAENHTVDEVKVMEEPREVRYVFGPDDLPPSKMEAKEAYRRSLVELNEASSQPSKSVTEMNLSPNPFMKRNESASVKTNIASEHGTHLNGVTDVHTVTTDLEKSGQVYFPQSEGEWPYLGLRTDSYQTTFDTPTRVHNGRLLMEYGSDDESEEQCKTPNMQTSEGFGNILTDPFLRPPPGLEHPALSGRNPDFPTQPQTGAIADNDRKAWLEIRLPTAKERNAMRARVRSIRDAGSDEPRSRKDNRAWWSDKMASREELDKLLAQVQLAHIIKTSCIDNLASEMQHKWENGGTFRSAMMTSLEAKKNAATVKAVTSILSTIYSAPIDENGLPCLGSRPYCHPADCLSRKGRHTVGNATRTQIPAIDELKMNGLHCHPEKRQEIKEPARLARDPRFRQLDDDWKPRGYEPKVSRFFGPNRRF